MNEKTKKSQFQSARFEFDSCGEKRCIEIIEDMKSVGWEDYFDELKNDFETEYKKELNIKFI